MKIMKTTLTLLILLSVFSLNTSAQHWSSDHLPALLGHGSAVNSVAFSPDGTTLASGSQDDTIKLWDVNTNNLLHTFEGHSEEVNSVAFSPDGTTLASSSGDKTIKLWDVNTGNLLYTLEGHSETVNSVAFSPDGTTLASGSEDKTIKLWEVNTNNLLHTLEGHSEEVNSVAFSPDGTTLASGSGDRTIKLWDVNTGDLLHTLEEHGDYVNSVVFSPDGTSLASGSMDNSIRLWKVSTGDLLYTLRGHWRSVISVAFSPDGTRLASGSADETIKLWKLPDTRVSITALPVDALAIGDQLTFNINIAEGENVTGYEAVVRFDETALRYVESVNGNYLPDDSFFVSPVVWTRGVRLGATSLAQSSSGDGILATLTFEFIAVKESTLTLSKTRLVNSAGKDLSHLHENDQTVVGIPRLREDVNLDGVVNILDLTLVAASFGKSSLRRDPIDIDGDVNQDGVVDIKDLIEINILNLSLTLDAARLDWRVEDSWDSILDNIQRSTYIRDPADVNEDGTIDIVDLVLVAGALGNVAAAPSAYPQALAMFSVTDVQTWLSQARRLNLTDPTAQRGVLFLQQLLAALIPKETVLLPNYPNPFNPETWIPYQLAESADVTLTIYAVDGTTVRTLALGHQSVGNYKGKSRAAYWDGRNELGESVASGLYFYTLTAGDFSATRKMLIRK